MNHNILLEAENGYWELRMLTDFWFLYQTDISHLIWLFFDISFGSVYVEMWFDFLVFLIWFSLERNWLDAPS